MKILGIIPARYQSTRFPGKPLIDIDGKTMIRRVYDQCSLANSLEKVIVATDNKRIFEHVKSFGGEVIMTSPEHPSGTDRCNEALSGQDKKYDFVINIQGDEPFIAPEQINDLASTLTRDTELATLIKAIDKNEDLHDPNVVKVVKDLNNYVIYFSRNPIPYLRNVELRDWKNKHKYFKHIGMYAYRSDILKKITELSPSSLEEAESLEQLRWIENGYRIKVCETLLESQGVDTPEDLKKLTQ